MLNELIVLRSALTRVGALSSKEREGSSSPKR